MRENTGRQTVTTINFADGRAAVTEWTKAEADTMQWVIDAYADQHRANLRDVEYLREYGVAEVFEYDLPGLYVTALMVDGEVMTAFAVEDDDITRLHTAARTGRTLRIRYVKPDGSVSRRETVVQSVKLTKAGHVVVRAEDRKADDMRTFRADRITHTTLHRATAPATPSKAALAAEFRATATPARPVVRSTGYDESRNSVWNQLDPASPARPQTAERTVSVVTDIYSTTPGTAAALEAPEDVQDRIAERYALGYQYAYVTV